MAELSTLARPYAKAAFEYARAANDLQGWSEQLAAAAAVAQQETMQSVLASPSLTSEQQAQAFVDVCGDALNAKGSNFVKVLAANKRLALLPEIYALFEAHRAAQEKSVDVAITTAIELDADTQQKLAQALKSKLDREVSVQVTVDEKLLGGVVIKAGDLVIDGSLRGRLAKLAAAMNA